jgi:YopX protein
MRQIKYRAWHRQRKRMFEVRSIDFSLNQVNGVWTGSGPEETGPVNLASCRLMEFTGLCDMKGREIYKGDIVDDTTNRIGIQQNTLVVRWNDKEAAFSLYDPGGKTIWWKPHLQEVIGNICEKRSLLGRDG